MKFPRPRIIDVFLGIVVLFVLAALFPGHNSNSPAVRRAEARIDMRMIQAAVMGYEGEYGHLPRTNRGAVDGDLVTALTGSNDRLNPRKIIFLESWPAKNGRDGLTNGTFVDSWGAPFQIAFASGTNEVVRAGTNDVEVKARVAVWSDPRLEAALPVWSFDKKDRHYVTSWEQP